MKNIKVYEVIDVNLYDSSNNLILSGGTGNLDIKLNEDVFDTSLSLSSGQGNLIKQQNYYATGRKKMENIPFRTPLLVNTGPEEPFPGVIAFLQSNHKNVSGKRQGSTADISITFTNFSATSSLNRTFKDSALQVGFGGLTQSPMKVLQKDGGQEVFGANQLLSWYDNGPADLLLCYKNFGVWIHFNFQFAGIGSRPVWYVTDNNFASWKLAGDDPSDPFTWPTSVGFNAVARPTSGHSSLSVEITIKDLEN